MMKEPLDYEPRFLPDPRVRRFWFIFFAAELVPIVAVFGLVPFPYHWGAVITVFLGAVITAAGLYIARWPYSYVLAVLLGIVGPICSAVIMVKLIALFK